MMGKMGSSVCSRMPTVVGCCAEGRGMEKVSERVLTDTSSLDRCPAAGAAAETRRIHTTLRSKPSVRSNGTYFFSLLFGVCVPVKARRGHWIPTACELLDMGAGIKLRSSARVGCALNC